MVIVGCFISIEEWWIQEDRDASREERGAEELQSTVGRI